MSDWYLKSACPDAETPICWISSTDAAELIVDEHELSCVRAKELASLGYYSQALTSYDRALAIRQNNAEVWIWRGGVLTHLDRYEEALASFEKALEIQPDNPSASLFRGIALHHLGRYKEAYASYDQALGIKRRSLFSRLIEFLPNLPYF
jgi:tetratricopeptide (TPR) repeat protein